MSTRCQRPTRLTVAAASAAAIVLFGDPSAARPPPQVLPDHLLVPSPYQQLRRALWLPGGETATWSLVTQAFDYLTMDQIVSWDPKSGAVDANITLTVQAQSPAESSFYVLIDEGLSIQSASAPGYVVDLVATPYPPFTYAKLSLDPPAATGQKVAVTFTYDGTLHCKPYGPRDSRFCNVGAELSFAMDLGLFPMVIDGADSDGFDVLERKTTLSVPSGLDVILSGELISSDDNGTTLTTQWQADSFNSQMYQVALAGSFATTPVPGVAPTCDVSYVAGSSEWTKEMAGWLGTIIPFLDEQAGTQLPFKHLTNFKLPEIDGFPGTATHSTVYLSERYGTKSAEYFEETLAHENSHLWWAVLVSPYDSSSWLTEGLAVLSQYDYTYATHYAQLDRGRYLGERYHWNELLLRYQTDLSSLPNLVLGSGEKRPEELLDAVTWAYFKSSATLDHLRVIIGDEVFADGLRAYRAACQMSACTSADFRVAMESTHGGDLSTFFDQWVYGTYYPELSVGFTQEQAPDGQWQVQLSLAQAAPLALPLEIWLEGVDGTTQIATVTLNSGAESFELSAAGRVRAVRPNPRHDAIVWSRSTQLGDPTMSATVDGRDLIRCARLEGAQALVDNPESVYDVNIDFDPRCDFDDDGDIDATDLDTIIAAFGEGVTS